MEEHARLVSVPCVAATAYAAVVDSAVGADAAFYAYGMVHAVASTAATTMVW